MAGRFIVEAVYHDAPAVRSPVGSAERSWESRESALDLADFAAPENQDVV